MRDFRAITGAVLIAVAFQVHAGPVPRETSAGALTLHRTLEADPVALLSMSLDDPAASFGQLVGLLEQLGLSGSSGWLGGLDGSAALLDQLGPELHFVLDLPPIDQAVAAAPRTRSGLLEALFGRIGLLAETRDPLAVERELARWAASVGAERQVLDGWNRLIFSETRTGGFAPELYYRIEAGKLAIGLSPEWVTSALAPRERSAGVSAGADWTRVFANLDENPTRLFYLNLPKLRRTIRESRVLAAVLEGQPDVAALIDAFVTSDRMGLGLGSTTVTVAGGARTTHFGPAWLSSGTLAAGLVVALGSSARVSDVVPGPVETTLEDIRSIATACESFSVDATGYPGPTDGWVPVERIAAYLEPVYILPLPRIDAWENPILYWSDGGTYRLISTGGDGRMDRDWSDPPESKSGTEQAGRGGSDIVFGDGLLLSAPVARAVR